MNPQSVRGVLVAGATLALCGGVFAQTRALPQTRAQAPAVSFPMLPDASPPCTLKQRVGLTEITIDYSRPGVKHRLVFGGIVPYGEVWRTGANASTKITFTTPVKLNGVAVPAGQYALYTIPDEKAWTVIVYKDPGLWGSFDYNSKNDFARFTAVPVKLADTVETFTIDFADIHDDSAMINLSWAKVRVPIRLEVEVIPDLLAKIQTYMDLPGMKTPDVYLQAAKFYYDHGQDLNKALIWAQTGLKDNPPIAYELLYVKAEILAKMGDRGSARVAAQQSMTLAIQAEGPGTWYTRLNQDIINGVRQ